VYALQAVQFLRKQRIQIWQRPFNEPFGQRRGRRRSAHVPIDLEKGSSAWLLCTLCLMELLRDFPLGICGNWQPIVALLTAVGNIWWCPELLITAVLP